MSAHYLLRTFWIIAVLLIQIFLLLSRSFSTGLSITLIKIRNKGRILNHILHGGIWVFQQREVRHPSEESRVGFLGEHQQSHEAQIRQAIQFYCSRFRTPCTAMMLKELFWAKGEAERIQCESDFRRLTIPTRKPWGPSDTEEETSTMWRR